jgi:SAM-dependent methyltransferase
MTYDATMAGAYLRGRTLRPADLGAWMAAAGPYLGERVLDLGAGTGRFTAALGAASGASVIACEPSAAMRAAYSGSASPLVGGSATHVPFAAGTFDAVWASQILHHLPDLAQFAGAMRHVLRPGGHLLIRGGFGDPRSLPLYPYFPTAFAPETAAAALLADLTRHCADAGLRRVARLEVGQRYADAAGELIAKVATRSLSNLAWLADPVFDEGLRRLTADARSGRLPFPIDERLDLVVFGPAGRPLSP